MIEKIIHQRRSIFPDQYTEEEISKDTIIQLLEAANRAPTHKKTEPWRFKILQGDALLSLGKFLSETYKRTTPTEKFSDFKSSKLLKNPSKAGAIIAICMQRDPKERIPEWEEIAATAMAVQNMWLLATELGLGAYWSSPGLIKYMHEFFDLDQGEKCLGFFYLGYYKEIASNETSRIAIEQKSTWL